MGTETAATGNGTAVRENQYVRVEKQDKNGEIKAGEMPSKETTFYLDVLSKAEGRHYTGTFTIKRLSINEVGLVGTDRARRNGGMLVDDNTDFINTMLAHLSRAVVKCDAEWGKAENLGQLFDIHVVNALYDEVMAFEARFRPTLS